LDAFLEFTERDILQDVGNVAAEMAGAHAESELEKYRIVQDRLFEIDFDRQVKQIESEHKQAVIGNRIWSPRRRQLRGVTSRPS
jgi:hypothetical protein